MKWTLTIAIVLLATRALADNDYDGHMYLSAAEDVYQRDLVAEKFVPTPFYLILEDEFPDGLGAWEARVVESDPSVTIMDVTLHPVDVALNVSLVPDSWVVGVACQVLGVEAKVTLATFHVLTLGEVSDALLTLAPVDPPLSTFSPSRGGDGIYTPGWVGCVGRDSAIHHAMAEDEPGGAPGTRNGYVTVNPSASVSSPATSWGALKATYR